MGVALLRAWRVLLVVPLLAALVTLGLYLAGPSSYRAVATVVVPTASQGQATAPVFVAQAVANFEGALRSDAVVHQTSAATGVPAADVAEGLSVDQNGTSQLVEVSFTGVRRDAVSTVVKTASERALALVVGGSLDAAQHELDLANQTYADAEQALSDFLATNGMVVPEQTFRRMNIRLLGLRDELGHARAVGDESEVTRLETMIEQKQTDLTAQVIEYQRLQVDRQRAIDGLKAADSAMNAAKSFVTTAQSGSAITPSGAVAVSRGSQLVRRLLAAIVVGLALAIVFVIVLDFVQPMLRAPQGPNAGERAVRLPPEARGRGPREGVRA